MATLVDKVSQIVRDNLADGQPDLEELPNGRVCGHVISSAFDGKDYECRRSILRRALEAGLNPDEMIKISTMLTYTPEEWSAQLEDV